MFVKTENIILFVSRFFLRKQIGEAVHSDAYGTEVMEQGTGAWLNNAHETKCYETEVPVDYEVVIVIYSLHETIGYLFKCEKSLKIGA